MEIKGLSKYIRLCEYFSYMFKSFCVNVHQDERARNFSSSEVLINFMAHQQSISLPLERPKFPPKHGKYFWTSSWFLATAFVKESCDMVLGHGYQISIRGPSSEGYLQETSMVASVYKTMTNFVAKLQRQQAHLMCHWSIEYVRALDC